MIVVRFAFQRGGGPGKINVFLHQVKSAGTAFSKMIATAGRVCPGSHFMQRYIAVANGAFRLSVGSINRNELPLRMLQVISSSSRPCISCLQCHGCRFRF